MNLIQLAELCHESVRIFSRYSGLLEVESWGNTNEFDKQTMLEMVRLAYSGGSPSALYNLWRSRYEGSHLEYIYLTIERQAVYCLIVDIVNSVTLAM